MHRQRIRALVLQIVMAISMCGLFSSVQAAVYFIHPDHLGTPRAVTNKIGTVVWRASHEPFGKAVISTQTIAMNLRFPGQYFDAETGLHYNYFRDYDPEVGRYLQSDPIGLVGGINTYAYGNGNALRFFDPTGLTPEGWWIKRPWPRIVGIRHLWGTAYRPDFSNNLQAIPPSWVPIMFPFAATAIIEWKVGCKEDCRSWTVSGSTGEFDINVDVPFKLAPHPALQKYTTLGNLAGLLIKPATSMALDRATEIAQQIFNSMTATSICINFTKDP